MFITAGTNSSYNKSKLCSIFTQRFYLCVMIDVSSQFLSNYWKWLSIAFSYLLTVSLSFSLGICSKSCKKIIVVDIAIIIRHWPLSDIYSYSPNNSTEVEWPCVRKSCSLWCIVAWTHFPKCFQFRFVCCVYPMSEPCLLNTIWFMSLLHCTQRQKHAFFPIEGKFTHSRALWLVFMPLNWYSTLIRFFSVRWS